MKLKKIRQLLKVFADDTRLRIVNILLSREVTVTDLCQILGKKQSAVSRHLTKMRHLGIAGDRRIGQNVYYHLTIKKDPVQASLIKSLISSFENISELTQDTRKTKKR